MTVSVVLPEATSVVPVAFCTVATAWATVVGGRSLAVIAGVAVAADKCVKIKVNPGLSVLSPAAAVAGSGYYSGRSGDGYCK